MANNTDYETMFKCSKCGNPFVVGIVIIEKDKAKCKCGCRKGHKKTILLPMSEKMNWIDQLTLHIYQCRCGNSVTDLKITTSGEMTNLVLYCNKHKERTRKIATILWNYISSSRSQMLTSSEYVDIEEDLPPPPPPPPQTIQQNLSTQPIKTPQILPQTSVNTIPIPQDKDLDQAKAAFCPVCGAVLSEAVKFCTVCGSEIDTLNED